MSDIRRRQKNGIRPGRIRNPRAGSGNLPNDIRSAAETEKIKVTDEILSELGKCIKRGGGAAQAALRQMITEHLLMYVRVHRRRPHAKESMRKLEKLHKAIVHLQGAVPRKNDPVFDLLCNPRFAWAYYAHDPDWTEFLSSAEKLGGRGLADIPDVLEMARGFIVTVEKLVGKSRTKKHVGLAPLVATLAMEWRFMTGRSPASGRDPITGKQSGPFADFVRWTMQALPEPLRSQPVDSTIRSVCTSLRPSKK